MPAPRIKVTELPLETAKTFQDNGLPYTSTGQQRSG
jgi:hypothetical protein